MSSDFIITFEVRSSRIFSREIERSKSCLSTDQAHMLDLSYEHYDVQVSAKVSIEDGVLSGCAPLIAT